MGFHVSFRECNGAIQKESMPPTDNQEDLLGRPHLKKDDEHICVWHWFGKHLYAGQVFVQEKGQGGQQLH